MPPGLAYVPVEAKPWRLRMGLRPLEPGKWLEVDEHRRAELELKHRLLTTPDSRGQVLATLDGSRDPALALWQLVVDDLAANHPGLVTVMPTGEVRDETTGQTVDPATMHPIEAAARVVQEDLCLMIESGGRWRLAAACVCFPSRWSLAEKIGRDLSAIHGPVPGYDAELAAPTQAFFDRLSPRRPMWRLNWTLLRDPALHQPDPRARQGSQTSISDPGRQLWFRVERQTLRRISAGSVAFTIRTYVTALGELVAAHPEAGRALAVALADVPDEVRRYKGWTEIAARVVEWLDRADSKLDLPRKLTRPES